VQPLYETSCQEPCGLTRGTDNRGTSDQLTNRRSVKELCALVPLVQLEEEDNEGERHGGMEEGLEY